DWPGATATRPGSLAYTELVQARGVVEGLVTGMRMVVAATVGTGFRLEGRLDRFDAGAELFEHRAQHIVVGQAQPTVAELQGNVAVAQVIGGAHQFEGAGAGDLHQLLGRRDNTHYSDMSRVKALSVLYRALAAFKRQADVLATGAEKAQGGHSARLDVQVQLGSMARGSHASIDDQHGRVVSGDG